MTAGTVLVTDPVGADIVVIRDTLAARGFSTIAPRDGEDWQHLAPRADGLIVNLAQVNAHAFASLTCCRVIARLGVGVNNVDLHCARARGITVTNVPDYCREEVSDHALALILALLRKLPQAHADVERGVWNQLGYRPIRRFSALTLGLIGYGRLARSLALKAHAIGVRVLAVDPYAKTTASDHVTLVQLDELLAEADAISLHVPLTNDTRGMIGQPQLRAMKSGAVLVNTSRGELVDEPALASALDEGRLSGAALDVFACEPLPSTSPLRGRANVLLTPHMAFYSEDSLEELQRIAAEDVARVLEGDSPRHRVDL